MSNSILSNVRYSYDNPEVFGVNCSGGKVPQNTRAIRSGLLSNGIKITRALFPFLSHAIVETSEAMQLGYELDCFVMSDPEMQAYCVPHSDADTDAFSVVLTSALIERLAPEELRFVIGHEVGHHICEHWRHPETDDEDSLAKRLSILKLSRSAEISADRIGMISSASLEHSCSAMIKTAAGLGTPHINPDISSILQQYRDLTDHGEEGHAIWSTHPVIPHRVRALMRFEPLCRKLWKGVDISAKELLELDELVENDFNRISGKALSKFEGQSIEAIRIWSLVYLVCADGVVTKVEQDLLLKVLGEITFNKVMQFLKSQEGDVMDAVEKKLNAACQKIGPEAFLEGKKVPAEFRKLCEQAGIIDGPIEGALEKLEALLG